MEQQASLFGQKIEEKVDFNKIKPKKTKKKEIHKEITEYKANTYGHSQIKGEFHDTRTIMLLSESNFDGTVIYHLNIEQSVEHSKGFLGGLWGLGGSFDLEDPNSIREFFIYIMNSKKKQLKQMYRSFTEEEREICVDYHYLYYDFRLVPADRFYVVISDKLIEMMDEQGFDFHKWYKRYQSLPENPADAKSFELAMEKQKLLEKGEEIEKEINVTQKMLKSLDEIKKEKFLGLTKQDILDRLKELGEGLYDISEQIIDVGRYIGVIYYSREWGFTLDKIKITKDYGKVKL